MTKDPKPTGFAHVSIANFIYSHKTLMNYKKTIEIEDAEREQSPQHKAQSPIKASEQPEGVHSIENIAL